MNIVQFTDLFPNLIVGWDPGYGNGKAVLIMPLIVAGPFIASDQIPTEGRLTWSLSRAPDGLWYMADTVSPYTRAKLRRPASSALAAPIWDYSLTSMWCAAAKQ